jgi:RNA polymerase sigma-70 factor (ECF subfamily)
MEQSADLDFTGSFEPRYRLFLETITGLRPSLHRYCARMTGSVLDGEDVVQEALIHAYRKLDTFDETRPLKPWLFRIAHNRCIDWLRRREVRREAETADLAAESIQISDSPRAMIDGAIEHLVFALPPKERACVLLKDVFDYSLGDIAELVDSTVGGVKAALNRGRSKLAELPTPVPPIREENSARARLLTLYVEKFNRRDWDGVRELIRADAQLRVADRYRGALAGSPYFGTYERWPTPWRLSVGRVDGDWEVIIHEREGDRWKPTSVIGIEFEGERIARIVDYFPCSWLLGVANDFEPGQTG